MGFKVWSLGLRVSSLEFADEGEGLLLQDQAAVQVDCAMPWKSGDRCIYVSVCQSPEP